MNERVLDGEHLRTREELHGQLASVLHLPQHYGRNLDALYDCLTECFEETTIVLLHFDALERNLGQYAQALRAVLVSACKDNPRLTLRLM